MTKFANSISAKFLLIFCAFILIPVIICGYMLIQRFETILIENNIGKNLQITEQISHNINNTTKSFIHTAASIINDIDVISDVSNLNSMDNPQLRLNTQKQIELKLENYFNYTTDLIGIVFVYKNGGYFYYKNPPRIKSEEIRAMDWYEGILQQKIKNKVFTLDCTDNFLFSVSKTSKAVSFAAVPDDKKPNNVGLVYFAFRPNTFEKIYSQLNLSDDWTIDIVSYDGSSILQSATNASQILSLPDDSTNAYGYQRYRHNNKDLLLTYYTVPNLNWRVIGSVPYKTLTRDIHITTTYVSIIFVTISILFFCVFFGSTFSTVIHPIHMLMNQMKKVETGNFQIRAPINNKNEIGQLNLSFYNMVDKIKELIEKVERKEQEKTQLEIKSLQYQINPHFLFNTLNTITTMAATYGVENVKHMTESLTKLLMNTLEKQGAYNTVEESFELLRNYEYIMGIKYSGRFHVQYFIDDNVRNTYILKMIVQPILENSIIHGFEDVFVQLHIDIHASCNDGDLLVTVEDDGVGLTQQQIDELMATEHENKSGFNKLGIYNVNKRIQLYYGKKYGLNMLRREPKGTIVQLKLPKLAKDMIYSDL